MVSVEIRESSGVKPKRPTPELKNLQNEITRKLSNLNIYTTSLNINMTAGKYPDVTIEGVLNTDIWPK